MIEPAPDILQSIPQLEQDIPASAFHAAQYGWLIAAAASIIILLLIVTIILKKRKRANQPIPPSAEELALRALEQLENTPLTLKQFSLELSMILREFLTGETQDPALFETHEEFSRRIDALATIPPENRNDIMNLLDDLARLKYAGEIERSHPPLKPMIDHARALVTRIADAQRQAQAAAAELAKHHKKP